jgi:hypothetical protein
MIDCRRVADPPTRIHGLHSPTRVCSLWSFGSYLWRKDLFIVYARTILRGRHLVMYKSQPPVNGPKVHESSKCLRRWSIIALSTVSSINPAMRRRGTLPGRNCCKHTRMFPPCKLPTTVVTMTVDLEKCMFNVRVSSKQPRLRTQAQQHARARQRPALSGAEFALFDASIQ